MGKQKQETKSTQQGSQTQQYQGAQTNQYGFIDTPINAQLQSVIDSANGPALADPSIQGRFATAEEDIRRSKMDPLGAYTTPFVRERATLSNLLTLGSQKDKAIREDRFRAENDRFGRQVTAASLTAPRFVQQGSTTSGSSSGTSTGSSTGVSTQGKDLFGNLIDVGLGAASL